MMHTLTLSNRLSLARLGGVVVFIILMLQYRAGLSDHDARETLRWLSAFLFLAASLTDALDGYLARSRHECTRLGSVLDPLADKALLISGLILLSLPTGGIEMSPRIPLWYAGLAIGRDILLIIGSGIIYLKAGRVKVSPRWSGKIATGLQMIIILKVLFQVPGVVFNVMLALAMISLLVSVVQYIIDGIRQLTDQAAGDTNEVVATGLTENP